MQSTLAHMKWSRTLLGAMQKMGNTTQALQVCDGLSGRAADVDADFFFQL
jgi:hypothetical protein